MESHSFSSDHEVDYDELKYPLSVSVQVTRECNLRCIYCSEPPVPDLERHPFMEELVRTSANLRGVQRIILTGGEPLIRPDIFEVISLFHEYPVCALATNATLLEESTVRRLSELVDYVDITVDGPRGVNNKIRGQYDRIVDGAKRLSNAGIEFSVVTVLLPQNAASIQYVCQIADTLGAKKLKIMPSIPKGRGQTLHKTWFSSDQLLAIFNKIREEKERNGWIVKITLADWSKIGKGHALLIHPDGEVVASPVFSEDNCIEHVGNILTENIDAIWKKYPYKMNHVQKYLEETLYVC